MHGANVATIDKTVMWSQDQRNEAYIYIHIQVYVVNYNNL